MKESMEAGDKESLKIIMNAKDLKFLDLSFENTTAFFSMMYILIEDHGIIFKEIYRFLKKNGEFHLWNFIIPRKGQSEKKLLWN